MTLIDQLTIAQWEASAIVPSPVSTYVTADMALNFIELSKPILQEREMGNGHDTLW